MEKGKPEVVRIDYGAPFLKRVIMCPFCPKDNPCNEDHCPYTVERESNESSTSTCESNCEHGESPRK